MAKSFQATELHKLIGELDSQLQGISKAKEQFGLTDMVCEELDGMDAVVGKGYAVGKEGVLLFFMSSALEDDGELKKNLSRLVRRVPKVAIPHMLPTLWEHVQGMSSLKRKKAEAGK